MSSVLGIYSQHLIHLGILREESIQINNVEARRVSQRMKNQDRLHSQNEKQIDIIQQFILSAKSKRKEEEGRDIYYRKDDFSQPSRTLGHKSVSLRMPVQPGQTLQQTIRQIVQLVHAMRGRVAPTAQTAEEIGVDHVSDVQGG